MAFTSLLQTRRQALATVIVAATASGNPGSARLAKLLVLRKRDPKELLLKIAISQSNIYGLWSTGLVKGVARLARYTFTGDEVWSQDLGVQTVFDVIVSGENEVMTVTIQPEPAGKLQVRYARFSGTGSDGGKDNIPLDDSLLAVAANGSSIYALDLATSLSMKPFGAAQPPTKMSPAFDIPFIGGMRPRSITATIHTLSQNIVLLDHVKARVVVLTPMGERLSNQLRNASIDAATEKQDRDVESRAAALRSAGKELAMSFPNAVSFAASNRSDRLWVVTAFGSRAIQIYPFDANFKEHDTVVMQIPDDPILNGRPPLLMSAAASLVGLGFREGAVALMDCSGA